MANSKLIVVEGPQGAGKTVITDYLRNTLPGTNLYRLSGTNDATASGKAKAEEMYFGLLSYIKTLENKSINLIFDRTFFTEENYCRLGKKEYSFTDVYNKLVDIFANLDFDLYYINLYLSDENFYKERLKREGKANVKYASFSTENSVKQQDVYYEMLTELNEMYPHINTLNLDNTENLEDVKSRVRKFVNY